MKLKWLVMAWRKWRNIDNKRMTTVILMAMK